MTLHDIIQRIIDAGAAQPAVRTICRRSAFLLNTEAEVDYGVFAYEQGTHRTDGNNMRYTFRLLYIDRLDEDGGNAEQVQSVGLAVLENTLSVLREGGLSIGEATYTPFNDRFVDECAVMMATVEITTPKQYLCEEAYDNEKSVKLI